MEIELVRTQVEPICVRTTDVSFVDAYSQSTTVNSYPSEYKDFVRIIRYDEFKVFFTWEVNGLCLVWQRSFVRINWGTEFNLVMN